MGAQVHNCTSNSTAEPTSHVVDSVLEQNGEGEIGNYWLLYEVVRGERERHMVAESSNIWQPV